MKRKKTLGLAIMLLTFTLVSIIGVASAQQTPPESLAVGDIFVYKTKTGTLLDQSATITYWELEFTNVSDPYLADRYTYVRGDEKESTVEVDVNVSDLVYSTLELASLVANENTTEIIKIYATVEVEVYVYTPDSTNEDSQIFVHKDTGLILEKVDGWGTENPTRYLLVSWHAEDMVTEFGEIHIIPGFSGEILAISSAIGLIMILVKTLNKKRQ